MSGLSASTYSCGGEGDRLGLGGEASSEGCLVTLVDGVALVLSTLWKNFRMPCFFSNCTSDSSSEGGGDREDRDDKSEESSSAIAIIVSRLLVLCLLGWLMVYFPREKWRCGSDERKLTR